jgi:hypothetical protein
METAHSTRGRSVARFLGLRDGPLFLSRTGRLNAHPVFAPVAWVVCLILGGLFWFAIGYWVVTFF